MLLPVEGCPFWDVEFVDVGFCYSGCSFYEFRPGLHDFFVCEVDEIAEVSVGAGAFDVVFAVAVVVLLWVGVSRWCGCCGSRCSCGCSRGVVVVSSWRAYHESEHSSLSAL